MKVGDLVRVISERNDYFGEIGIVTHLLNGGYFLHVMVPSGEFIFIPEALEVIG